MKSGKGQAQEPFVCICGVQGAMMLSDAEMSIGCLDYRHTISTAFDRIETPLALVLSITFLLVSLTSHAGAEPRGTTGSGNAKRENHAAGDVSRMASAVWSSTGLAMVRLVHGSGL